MQDIQSKGKYVFISYSSQNTDIANSVRERIEKCGISTWMAPDDIPVGSTYPKSINVAIINCSCFLLILTDASQSSVWVGKEVERAISKKRPLLPVEFEHVDLNDAFDFYLCDAHRISMQGKDIGGKAFDKVITTIKSYVGVANNDKADSDIVINEKTQKKAVAKQPQSNDGKAYDADSPFYIEPDFYCLARAEDYMKSRGENCPEEYRDMVKTDRPRRVSDIMPYHRAVLETKLTNISDKKIKMTSSVLFGGNIEMEFLTGAVEHVGSVGVETTGGREKARGSWTVGPGETVSLKFSNGLVFEMIKNILNGGIDSVECKTSDKNYKMSVEQYRKLLSPIFGQGTDFAALAKKLYG